MRKIFKLLRYKKYFDMFIEIGEELEKRKHPTNVDFLCYPEIDGEQRIVRLGMNDF